MQSCQTTDQSVSDEVDGFAEDALMSLFTLIVYTNLGGGTGAQLCKEHDEIELWMTQLIKEIKES